jgi:site-specific recombinase XerD
MTLEQAVNDFISSRILAGLSPKTVETYRNCVLPFIRFVGKEILLSALGREVVDTYIAHILTRPLAKASKATYIKHLRIFLRWCEKKHGFFDIAASTIKVPKAHKKVVRIYSDVEINMIFRAVTSSLDWLTLRNKAIVALMLDSGLRQAEVCGLSRSNVYAAARFAKVCGKGEKERTIPLGEVTIGLLERYLAACPYDTSKRIFVSSKGRPLTPDAVKHLMRRVAGRLPFELSSHRLRHNFATNYCLDQYERYGQVDIYRLMVLLGHEDIETTRRYLHLANQIIATRTSISHIDAILSPSLTSPARGEKTLVGLTGFEPAAP